MIGLLGGTFDPIHYGHLRPAHEVHRRLGFELLHVVPVSTPPHRGPPVASPADRLRMVELAVAEFPGLVADDREIRRGGVSYTVPTLEELRAGAGDRPVCLLVGADAYAGLPAWHRWERLFELAHIVVMQRPGTPPPARDRAPSWAAGRIVESVAGLAGRPAGGILFVTVTPCDVSATRLRALIAEGETPPRDALPAAVWEYIRRHGLYRHAA